MAIVCYAGSNRAVAGGNGGAVTVPVASGASASATGNPVTNSGIIVSSLGGNGGEGGAIALTKALALNVTGVSPSSNSTASIFTS